MWWCSRHIQNWFDFSFLNSFSPSVGWHYNLTDQFYNTPTASSSLYHPQPDSTSSAASIHQQSADIGYFNNSTDSSDYVTTTSNQQQLSIQTTNASVQSNNNLSHGNTNFQQRRGSLQLWQFLIALLDEPSSRWGNFFFPLNLFPNQILNWISLFIFPAHVSHGPDGEWSSSW